MGKGKTTRASATLKIHFSVGKAEAKGYRYFIERQGRLVKGSRRVKILDTKWYPSQTEAQKGLKKARRNWLGRL